MTKSQRKYRPPPNKIPPRVTDAGPWRGDETRAGAGGSETPEAAAERAEGNAPLSVAEAQRRSNELPDEAPSTIPPPPVDAADSRENLEEKREAAAEEHAAEPDHPHSKY